MLAGGAGNDRLDGGAGNDLLWGGGGADAFVFRPMSGADTIMDFVAGQDRIELVDIYESYQEFVDAGAFSLGGSTIDLGGGNTIALVGVQVSALTQDDFHFNYNLI